MNEAEAVQLLREICRQDGHPQAIRNFQTAVWNAAGGTLGPSDDFLREVAYDLDFYEPDAAARAEDWSYYDEVRLRELLLDALRRLE